jgi:hypothetical protein
MEEETNLIYKDDDIQITFQSLLKNEMKTYELYLLAIKEAKQVPLYIKHIDFFHRFTESKDSLIDIKMIGAYSLEIPFTDDCFEDRIVICVMLVIKLRKYYTSYIENNYRSFEFSREVHTNTIQIYFTGQSTICICFPISMSDEDFNKYHSVSFSFY